MNAEPDGFDTEATAILRGVGDLYEERCDRHRLLRLLPGFDILVLRFGVRVDAELLAGASRLRVIGCPATGTEHIDCDAANALGIRVVSLKGDRAFLQTVTATAELAWGLLLTVVRKLHLATRHVANGHWERDQFQGMQLRGKTVGIIGYGRLGRMTAEHARAFSMRVLAHDPYVSQAPSWITLMPLSEVLAQADAVFLHVPLTPETMKLMNSNAFSAMKPGTILINTSRGEVIDEDALIQAMDSGRIGGAGLDVLAGESLKDADWPRCNTLWQRAQTDQKLILTPHIGGKTQESNRDADIFLARKIQRHFCR